MEKHELVKVDVEDKDAGCTRINLNRLIIARGMKDSVRTSVVNGEVYLERMGQSNDIS